MKERDKKYPWTVDEKSGLSTRTIRFPDLDPDEVWDYFPVKDVNGKVTNSIFMPVREMQGRDHLTSEEYAENDRFL